MATNVDWFRQTLEKIAVSDARTELLSELKVALCGLSSNDVKSVARTLPLGAVFDCLNTSEKQQIELACEVLGKFLSSLEPSAVLTQYGTQIQRTLIHPALCAKELVLREVNRAVGESADMVERLSTEQELLVSVVNCLCEEDSSLARHAVALLKRLGICKSGLTTLYSPVTTNALQTAASQGDVIRCRVYEVVVGVSVLSEQGLEASQSSGILGNLLNELQGNDVLAQLNVLEMLASLALTPHGNSFLDQKGILNFLAEKLISASEDPLGALLSPGLIKFFGNIAQSKPDYMMQRFPKLVLMMFETLDSPDNTIVGIGMETLGYIASTWQGKLMLESSGKVCETLRKIFQKMPSFPMDVRVRLLNSVANVLQLKVPDQNNHSLTLTKSWFESMTPQPMDSVMSVCRQPFPEMRLAGFQLLQVLASNPWGQEHIARAPGVIEYLLDRSTESIKSCKDAKFDVVRTLLESPSSAAVLSPDILDRLQEFVREGEFYERGVTEVAIEGAS